MRDGGCAAFWKLKLDGLAYILEYCNARCSTLKYVEDTELEEDKEKINRLNTFNVFAGGAFQRKRSTMDVKTVF